MSIRRVVLCALSLLLLAGCSSTTPAPTLVSATDTPSSSAPIAVGNATAGPTLAATPAPGVASVPPISTAVPLATFTPLSIGTTVVRTVTTVPTLTPSRVPSTPTPRATAFPPGVYVTALRLLLDHPLSGQSVAFVASFVNNTAEARSLDWRVLVYKPGDKKSFGNTSIQHIVVPVGNSEFTAPNWNVSGLLDCQPYVAQANSVDADKVPTAFTSTDGKIVSLNFQVCPGTPNP